MGGALRASSPTFEKQGQSPLTGTYPVAAPNPSPSQGQGGWHPTPRDICSPSPGSPGAHPSPGMFWWVRRWTEGFEEAAQRGGRGLGADGSLIPHQPPRFPASATPTEVHTCSSREKTKRLVKGETCQRKEPAKVAEQGFSWPKKLEEGGNKQAVAELKKTDTEGWTGHTQDGCDAVECTEDWWGGAVPLRAQMAST